MPAFIHILIVLLAIAGSACGKDPARSPDAQQLARINKELAILDARVEALSKRLDRLEQTPQQPQTQQPQAQQPQTQQPETPSTPATTATPANDQPAPASNQPAPASNQPAPAQ